MHSLISSGLLATLLASTALGRPLATRQSSQPIPVDGDFHFACSTIGEGVTIILPGDGTATTAGLYDAAGNCGGGVLDNLHGQGLIINNWGCNYVGTNTAEIQFLCPVYQSDQIVRALEAATGQTLPTNSCSTALINEPGTSAKKRSVKLSSIASDVPDVSPVAEPTRYLPLGTEPGKDLPVDQPIPQPSASIVKVPSQVPSMMPVASSQPDPATYHGCMMNGPAKRSLSEGGSWGAEMGCSYPSIRPTGTGAWPRPAPSGYGWSAPVLSWPSGTGFWSRPASSSSMWSAPVSSSSMWSGPVSSSSVSSMSVSSSSAWSTATALPTISQSLNRPLPTGVISGNPILPRADKSLSGPSARKAKGKRNALPSDGSITFSCTYEDNIGVETYDIVLPGDGSATTTGFDVPGNCGIGVLNNMNGQGMSVTDWGCNYIGTNSANITFNVEFGASNQVTQAIIAATGSDEILCSMGPPEPPHDLPDSPDPTDGSDDPNDDPTPIAPADPETDPVEDPGLP